MQRRPCSRRARAIERRLGLPARPPDHQVLVHQRDAEGVGRAGARDGLYAAHGRRRARAARVKRPAELALAERPVRSLAVAMRARGSSSLAAVVARRPRRRRVRGAGRFLVVADPAARARRRHRHAGRLALATASSRAAASIAPGVAPLVVLTRERLRRGAPPRSAPTASACPRSTTCRAGRSTSSGSRRAPSASSRRATAAPRARRATIARWACRQRVPARLVVVTSPTHTRRARMILRQALGPGVQLTRAAGAATPCSRPIAGGAARRAIKDVLIEYQKLARLLARRALDDRAVRRAQPRGGEPLRPARRPCGSAAPARPWRASRGRCRSRRRTFRRRTAAGSWASWCRP